MSDAHEGHEDHAKRNPNKRESGFALTCIVAGVLAALGAVWFIVLENWAAVRVTLVVSVIVGGLLGGYWWFGGKRPKDWQDNDALRSVYKD